MRSTNHLPIILHLLTPGQITLPMTATILTAMINQMFRLTLRHTNPHPTQLTLNTPLKTTTPLKPQLLHTTTLISSYPSFQDSTAPSVLTHQSSFNPASDGPAATSYTPASNSSAPTHYHSTAESSPQLNPPAAPPASQYKYDSSYQPEVEKIAEAHKAARFAVGALAFDDVSVAVDHLKRALDLLTNPSAEPH
jgi:hypothetical protein